MFKKFFSRNSQLTREPAGAASDLEIDLSPLWESEPPVATAPAAPAPESFDDADPFLEMARRAFEQLEVEEIRRGAPYPPDHRMKVLNELGKQLADQWMRDQRQRDVGSGVDFGLEEVLQALEQVSGLLQEQIDLQPANLAGRMWREHPFLTGYLGAGIWHAIKGRQR